MGRWDRIRGSDRKECAAAVLEASQTSVVFPSAQQCTDQLRSTLLIWNTLQEKSLVSSACMGLDRAALHKHGRAGVPSPTAFSICLQGSVWQLAFCTLSALESIQRRNCRVCLCAASSKTLPGTKPRSLLTLTPLSSIQFNLLYKLLPHDRPEYQAWASCSSNFRRYGAISTPAGPPPGSSRVSMELTCASVSSDLPICILSYGCTYREERKVSLCFGCSSHIEGRAPFWAFRTPQTRVCLQGTVSAAVSAAHQAGSGDTSAQASGQAGDAPAPCHA